MTDPGFFLRSAGPGWWVLVTAKHHKARCLFRQQEDSMYSPPHVRRLLQRAPMSGTTATVRFFGSIPVHYYGVAYSSNPGVVREVGPSGCKTEVKRVGGSTSVTPPGQALQGDPPTLFTSQLVPDFDTYDLIKLFFANITEFSHLAHRHFPGPKCLIITYYVYVNYINLKNQNNI